MVITIKELEKLKGEKIIKAESVLLAKFSSPHEEMPFGRLILTKNVLCSLIKEGLTKKGDKVTFGYRKGDERIRYKSTKEIEKYISGNLKGKDKKELERALNYEQSFLVSTKQIVNYKRIKGPPWWRHGIESSDSSNAFQFNILENGSELRYEILQVIPNTIIKSVNLDKWTKVFAEVVNIQRNE